MEKAKHERQLKELRTKLSAALAQVERIRAGKLERRTLKDALREALAKST